MSQPSPKDFSVAIVGGGMCGLTCAIALQRAGVQTSVFEAAATFGEIGAGIGIGPNAVRVLKSIGILEDVLKRINPAELRGRGFVHYSGLGEHEKIYTQQALSEDRGIGMHRATFLDALVAVVEPGSVSFNKRCISITETSTGPKRYTIHFHDGTSHEADVVLGADGIKSVVRGFVVGGEDKRVVFSNTIVYRGLVPHASLKAAGFKTNVTDLPVNFMGPNKHFILFPIKNAEIINVVAFSARYDISIGREALPDGSPWVEEASRDVLKDEYAGWGPDVVALVKCMPEKPSKWSIHVINPPLDSYARGHVALLGDAAHAMLPHLGAGAGQGIEDAYMLARLLSHPGTHSGNLKAVLDAYSRIRQPRAQMVWEASRHAGVVYDCQGPHGSTVEGLRQDLQNLFHPVWHHNMEDDVQKAMDSLCRRGAFSCYTN